VAFWHRVKDEDEGDQGDGGDLNPSPLFPLLWVWEATTIGMYHHHD